MDINNLISQYGYAALVIGSVAEGETITLLGGVAAHQGLLKFWLVVISVALGGMIGDQLHYLGVNFYHARLSRRGSDWPVAASSGCASEALDLADSGGGAGGCGALVAKAPRGKEERVTRVPGWRRKRLIRATTPQIAWACSPAKRSASRGNRTTSPPDDTRRPARRSAGCWHQATGRAGAAR